MWSFASILLTFDTHSHRKLVSTFDPFKVLVFFSLLPLSSFIQNILFCTRNGKEYCRTISTEQIDVMRRVIQSICMLWESQSAQFVTYSPVRNLDCTSWNQMLQFYICWKANLSIYSITQLFFAMAMCAVDNQHCQCLYTSSLRSNYLFEFALANPSTTQAWYIVEVCSNGVHSCSKMENFISTGDVSEINAFTSPIFSPFYGPCYTNKLQKTLGFELYLFIGFFFADTTNINFFECKYGSISWIQMRV